MPYARAEFQIDAMDMNILQKEGEEKYALIVIDAFSKLGNGVPMKKRTSVDVLDVLKQYFKILGGPIEFIAMMTKHFTRMSKNI